MKTPKHHIFLIALLGILCFFFSEALAGKAYMWRDKDGKIHFSSRKPHPTTTEADVKEREFKEPPPPEKLELDEASKSPIDHAVQCTFRLKNKKGGASGFFINDKGLAVTAKHVVKGVTYSMKAELAGDKKKYRVRVIKKSNKLDLALIQIAVGKPTPYLEMRDPKTLVRGEEVWAIGNPLLAFKETVTKGTFSRIFPGKDWKKELKMKPPYKGDWIQFSAPVTGGNSGGPVVDKDGKLIGVVSMGLTNYGAINFAVPSSYISSQFKSYLK
jgi:serine protease Do